jgi:hypothetical protein
LLKISTNGETVVVHSKGSTQDPTFQACFRTHFATDSRLHFSQRGMRGGACQGGFAKALRNNGRFYRAVLFATTAAFVDE